MKKLMFLTLCLLAWGGFAHADEGTDKIKVKGDLRYRHESIDAEGKDVRNRHRVRARLAVEGKVSEYTRAAVQLATGSSDPVSTNQTLGDAFSSKNVVIDMAYFEAWHKSLPGLKVKGGKFHNPFHKPGGSELIWDSDWNPEGASAHYTRDFKGGSIDLIGAGLWVEERSSAKESYVVAGQGVVHLDFNEKKTGAALGAGYFNFANSKGYPLFYDGEDSFGNSTIFVVDGSDSILAYANEYRLFEIHGEFKQQFNGIPLVVMGDFVTNTAADSLGTGWLIGFHLGKAKKTGSWQVRYIYREVKKDAMVGIFTDSDFRGGGTDAKGHEFGGEVQLTDNTTFAVSYFINEIGLEAAQTSDFKRLQVDLQLKF